MSDPLDGALCRRLDPQPWLDGSPHAAAACLSCPALAACRAHTRSMVSRGALPVGVSQAGVKWPVGVLSRRKALAMLDGSRSAP